MKKNIQWSNSERRIWRSFRKPFDVQCYLDALPYNIGEITHSPREVIKCRNAHCFDGALFAAAAFEEMGYKPLLLDLRANDQDDDHVLALFKIRGLWGAVAKSNYTGCRYRDPVYRTLRELAMSYFHIYFNLAGIKTLREFSLPFKLTSVRDIDWRMTDQDLSPLGARLDAVQHFYLIDPRSERILAPADERTFRAETLGLDPRGAFKVKKAYLLNNPGK